MKKLLLANILLLTLFIASSHKSSAQELTNVESRQINYMVLDAVERYEDFAGVYDEDSEYEFVSLFQSPDSPVFAGDLLLGYGNDETLPASEYATKLLDFAPNVSVKISSVRKGQPYYEAGLWYVPVNLKKSLEYTDGSLIISSDLFYGDLYDITLLMACDLESQRCRICSVEGSIDSDEVFPLKYIVVRKPSESNAKLSLDNLITVGGKRLEYNSLDYAIIPEGSLDSFAAKEMKHEIRIRQEIVDSTYRHKEMEFEFEKTRGRFKIRNKFAPISAYEVSEYNPSSGLIADKSWAYELGFDLGFGAPVGKTGATRFGLFFGAALNYSNLTLSSGPFNYSYTLNSAHGNPYGNIVNVSNVQYQFDINSVTENVSFVDVVVPLYMSFDHRFGKKGRIWLNWNVGVKFYYNLNDLIGWSDCSYTVNGSYSVFNSATGSNIGGSDFSGQYNQFLNPTSYPIFTPDLTASANAALHIRLSRSAFLTLGAGYEHGFEEITFAEQGDYFSNGSVYPFVSDSNNSVVAVHSMYESVRLKRKALWLDLGFMFKF